MLVMSRHANESIILNHQITVTVIEIRGDKVRLGIEAPAHASVHRGEVYTSPESTNDDPYQTVVQTPGMPSAGNDRFPAGNDASDATRLRIDRDRPLESLKRHLLAVLGETQYDQIRPLLNQLTESRGISVAP